MKNKKKGISLITLVITIIVIVVLAAAVVLALSRNNPIENAKEATFKSDVKNLQEQLNMYISKQTIDTLGKFKVRDLDLNETTTPNINEILTSIKGSNLEGEVEVKDGNLVYIGDIKQETTWFKEIMGEAIPGVVVTGEAIYTSKNSEGKVDIATIPQGFKVSEKEDEQTIETGLVVIAPDESEFVWVPVPKEELNLFAEYDGTFDRNGNSNMRGKIWKFEKGGVTTGSLVKYSENGRREPDAVLELDNDLNNLNTINAILNINLEDGNDLKEFMQEEFNDIYGSVEKYHGFYIGRYETGNFSQDKIVSKKGNTDIASQTWYTMYAKEKKYTTQLTGTSVKSNMVYESQWDAVMRWFSKSSNSDVANYPVNAQDGVNANFSGASIATGSLNAINNIYDMAGNVWEWTSGADSTRYRDLRGYNQAKYEEYYFAGFHGRNTPDTIHSTYGSRLSLYL